MTGEQMQAIQEVATSLAKQMVMFEGAQVPASVVYLLDLLAKETSKENRQDLYSLLCSQGRDFSLGIKFHRQEVAEFPDDVMPTLSLANALHTVAVVEGGEREESIALSRKALEMAKANNEWIKFCGVCLARNATYLSDYPAIEHALSELILDAPNWRDLDYQYEFDFLDRIDRSKLVDPNLLDRYAALNEKPRPRADKTSPAR